MRWFLRPIAFAGVALMTAAAILGAGVWWMAEEAGAAAGGSPATIEVQVDSGQVLGPVKPLVYGINTASWDEQLFPGTLENWALTFDQDAVRKVKAAGIRFLRYPGGGDGDKYIWNSPANSPLRMDTEEFLLFCRLVGAEPSISVNYPAGPELAAQWVRYVNLEKGAGVRYWEIGDEEYFSVPADVYAERVVAFSRAMKAVDPSIRIGAGVSVPRSAWTREVLRKAGDAIDFVVYNWFPQSPGKENDAQLLASPSEFRTHLRALRTFLRQAVGERADAIEIHIGGYSSVSAYPGPQSTSIVTALWMAETLGVMVEEGVDAAGFWALHNAYPPRGGDFGIMASTPENRPYPTYYVFPLFTQHFGSYMVRANSPDPALVAFASVGGEQADDSAGADGGAAAGRAQALYVLLINKDPQAARQVRLAIQGFQGSNKGLGWVLSERSRLDRMVPRPDLEEGFEVPPYSAVVVQVPAAAPKGPQVQAGTGQALPILSARASSSAELGPQWGPQSAIDGDRLSRWASAIWTENPEWFEVDMGGLHRVSALRLVWETHATRYRVEVSEDGARWRSVYETSEGKGGEELIRFEPTAARYVRLQLLERPKERGTAQGMSIWTAGSYSLWEVEVLGD